MTGKPALLKTAWTLLTLASLLVLTILSGCMSLSENSADSGAMQMTLDSGVDKKVSRSNMHMTEGGTFVGSVGLDNMSAVEEMRFEKPMSAPAPPPQDDSTSASSGGSVISQALAFAGVDEEKINGWMFPKAYAKDHGADEQYLVRTGDVSLEVSNYEDAQTKIADIADSFEGYVSNSNSQKYSDARVEGWITIRVPADKFFLAWEQVRGTGDILQEQISTEDVSRQFLANHSQIKNLLAQQVTLQEMLNEAVAIQRLHGLGEGHSLLLDVQERLFNVTSQLQSVEDRQNALASQITKSTITVHMTEVKEVAAVVEQVKENWNWGTDKTVGDAYKSVLNRLRNLWQGIIWFVFTAWNWIIPLCFWILAGVFVYRKWIRPYITREQAKTAGQGSKLKGRNDNDKDKPDIKE